MQETGLEVDSGAGAGLDSMLNVDVEGVGVGVGVGVESIVCLIKNQKSGQLASTYAEARASAVSLVVFTRCVPCILSHERFQVVLCVDTSRLENDDS